VEGALAEVEAAAGPRVLVTAGHGKFWTNGLDLDWMAARPGQSQAYLRGVQALLARTPLAGKATPARAQIKEVMYTPALVLLRL
jgi:Delta3-Delta2-enoyl-CoA isomerase